MRESSPGVGLGFLGASLQSLSVRDFPPSEGLGFWEASLVRKQKTHLPAVKLPRNEMKEEMKTNEKRNEKK